MPRDQLVASAAVATPTERGRRWSWNTSSWEPVAPVRIIMFGGLLVTVQLGRWMGTPRINLISSYFNRLLVRDTTMSQDFFSGANSRGISPGIIVVCVFLMLRRSSHLRGPLDLDAFRKSEGQQIMEMPMPRFMLKKRGCQLTKSSDQFFLGHHKEDRHKKAVMV